jgi:hypothetical protein
VHPQLQAVVDEFEDARRRLRALVDAVPEASWPIRPTPERWSVAECVAHLNLTSAAYLPILLDGVRRARELGVAAPRTYRRDVVGWLLWRGSGPPVKVRVKTTAPFIPQSAAEPFSLFNDFESYHARQIALIQMADGLPIQRVMTRSAFNPRIRYSLFSAMTILPRHQHRHLWQAEQAWITIRAASEAP